MMKNSILFFSLFAGMFLFPPNGVASYKSTHTSTPKPEPAFQFEQTDKTYKTAAVCFLGVGDCDNEISYGKGGDGEDYTVDTAAQCKNEGFILNNCNSVQVPEGYCPYNKSYVTRCKCASNLVTCPAGQVGVGESCGGKYASCKCDPALKTCSSKEVGQGASCGGKYQSCACKSEYAYNTSNCTSPRSPTGDSCGGKYTQCTCPAGVSAGAYGCEEYYPAPCNTVCKKAYADNCRNRTEAISGCPANATCSYFSDCFSKISSWSCNDGYVKSGNECVVEKKGTCEDYGYSSTEPSGEKCISRWVLELSKFCYTDECKVCQLGLLCANGCAEYNRPEDMADLYNCPRVCVSCNQAPATKPDCGSQSLISCNGTYYCCDPRFASCYYTTSHNGTNGTVTYMCSVAGKVSSSVDGVVEGVTIVP